MEPLEGNMADASEPEDVSTKQQRIAELAKQSPQMGFTSLAHLIDLDWLHEAYRRTRKDGAVGVDGQTAADYEADLEDNLRSLLDRAKSGTYRAPPVRRVHIPKGRLGPRPGRIGIPTLEDKVLQRAVVMVLEADLRAGLSGLLVRLPAGAIGASGAGQPLAADDGDGRRLDRGSGHPEVFRHSGSCSSAGACSSSGCVTGCCCD